jgi:NAD(P)-dependent dehydrogenase (short-subunit alcohol dehydrogenase family)
MSLLRGNLLGGTRVAVGGSVAQEVSDQLVALGAELELLDAEALADDEERVGEWARARAPLHAVIYFAARRFGEGGEEALSATLEDAWAAVREVAVGALIEAERPGKVVLVGPPPDAGPLAGAVGSALENLVRTLSVEWARYQLTAVMVAPGRAVSDAELATLVCFILSEGGGYLSGCRLELGAVG